MGFDRYNRYSGNYQTPSFGMDPMIYEYTDDSQYKQQLMDILAERQDRYDLGRQKQADVNTKIGQLTTSAPGLLRENLDALNEKISTTVKNNYGEDYGLAINEISDIIANEMSNPLYAAIIKQNQGAEAELQAKLKDPNKFFYKHGKQSVVGEDALRTYLEGVKTGDIKKMQALTPEFGYEESSDPIIEDIVSHIPDDVYTSLLQSLSPKERQTVQNEIGDIRGLLKSTTVKSLDRKRLERLKGSIIESLLDRNPTLIQKYGEEGGKAEAERLVTSALPQFVKHQQTSTLDNLTGLLDNDGSGSEYYPTSTRTTNNQPLQDTYSKAEETFGSEEGKIDLVAVSNRITNNNGEIIEPWALETFVNKEIEEHLNNKPIVSPTAIGGPLSKKEEQELDEWNKIYNALLFKKKSLAEGSKAMSKYEKFEDDNYRETIGESLLPEEFFELNLNDRVKEAARIEDAYVNYNNQYLTMNNFSKDAVVLAKKFNEEFHGLDSSGDKIPVIFLAGSDIIDGAGNKVKVDGNDEFNIDNKILDVNRKDYGVRGFDTETGRLIFQRGANNKNSDILKGYYNDQHAAIGNEIVKANDGLNKNGFYIFNDGKTNYLIVKKQFDKNDRQRDVANPYGKLVDAVVPLESNQTINSLKDAKDILLKNSQKYQTLDKQNLYVNILRNSVDAFNLLPKNE